MEMSGNHFLGRAEEAKKISAKINQTLKVLEHKEATLVAKLSMTHAKEKSQRDILIQT